MDSAAFLLISMVRLNVLYTPRKGPVERSTMRKVILTLLVVLVFAVPALAEKDQEQFDHKNVYDAFSELKLKPSTGVTLEEEVKRPL